MIVASVVVKDTFTVIMAGLLFTWVLRRKWKNCLSELVTFTLISRCCNAYLYLDTVVVVGVVLDHIAFACELVRREKLADVKTIYLGCVFKID